MALKTIVTVVDDVTGEESEDISTVEFALDGVGYVIDLTDKNAQELRDALSGYVTAARRTGGRQRARARPPVEPKSLGTLPPRPAGSTAWEGPVKIVAPVHYGTT